MATPETNNHSLSQADAQAKEVLDKLKELNERVQRVDPEAQTRGKIDEATELKNQKDTLFERGQHTFEESVGVHKEIVKTQVKLLLTDKAKWKAFKENAETQRVRMNVFLKDYKEHKDDERLEPIFNRALGAIQHFQQHDTIRDLPANATDAQIDDAAHMLAYSEILKKEMDLYDQYRGNFASYKDVFKKDADIYVGIVTDPSLQRQSKIDEIHMNMKRTMDKYEEFRRKNPDATKDNAYVKGVRKKLADANSLYATHYANMKSSSADMAGCLLAFQLMKEQLDRYDFYLAVINESPEMEKEIVRMAEMEARPGQIQEELIAGIMQEVEKEEDSTADGTKETVVAMGPTMNETTPLPRSTPVQSAKPDTLDTDLAAIRNEPLKPATPTVEPTLTPNPAATVEKRGNVEAVIPPVTTDTPKTAEAPVASAINPQRVETPVTAPVVEKPTVKSEIKADVPTETPQVAKADQAPTENIASQPKLSATARLLEKVKQKIDAKNAKKPTVVSETITPKAEQPVRAVEKKNQWNNAVFNENIPVQNGIISVPTQDEIHIAYYLPNRYRQTNYHKLSPTNPASWNIRGICTARLTQTGWVIEPARGLRGHLLITEVKDQGDHRRWAKLPETERTQTSPQNKPYQGTMYEQPRRVGPVRRFFQRIRSRR